MAQNDAITIYFAQNDAMTIYVLNLLGNLDSTIVVWGKPISRGEEVPGTTLGFRD